MSELKTTLLQSMEKETTKAETKQDQGNRICFQLNDKKMATVSFEKKPFDRSLHDSIKFYVDD